MASELARQILDAGFPAAKPVREHDLFGIPTLEELIAAVEQLRPEFCLSVRRINPDEWEAETAFVSRMSEFPSRRTDHSPLEIRAPGTEFLDAETGGQKSTQETANVWGERKTGTTPANIPAETAYLESVWKPVVRSDCRTRARTW